MALVMCPLCTDTEEIELVEKLPDGRKRVQCPRCDYTWVADEPREERRQRAMTAVQAMERFPKPENVDAQQWQRAERLKSQYLGAVRPEADPRVIRFWAKYQRVFSAEGLPTCDPADLKDFANAHEGVYVGFMTELNNAWNRLD